jgi:hypothetical protein
MASTVGHAATPLTVDLAAKLGPVTHVASGSLYGVLEKQPADVTALLAPLRPNMFNSPAADVQQPIGDAIVVAGRVAALGARVTIRLADWFPSWPYAFTNVSDWFGKLEQTVSRRQTANLTNIYAYEIWNEPDGTWKNASLAFNDFWKQTYDELRHLDPTIKITGPSTSYFNQSYLQSFLSYCKTNNCLPDIIGWHELSGGNVTGNVQSYRSLEKQLGIGPLPISINEYSGRADLTVEGQPGASASLIAKFERLGVDSACISFWDVGHPGRLGSLLATNTDPNGGWWFYKWYGDMAGDMISTTPANAGDSAALDGFANLDGVARSASVLFGGVNDGSVQVVVKGFGGAGIFGSTVHLVVEHTPFVNRTTVVKATSVVQTTDVTIVNDQIVISVPGTNNTDGYRVSLTPLGGGGGGTGGISGGDGGGAAGGGGGGASGGKNGGAGGTGPATGSGGAGVTRGSGGSAGSPVRNGGSTGTGASNGAGGNTASGGASATGGRSGSGGTSSASGGAPAGSGTGGSAPGSGGSPGSGGNAPAGTGGAGGSRSTEIGGGQAGCACDLESSASPSGTLSGVGLVLLAVAMRRRRGEVARPTP